MKKILKLLRKKEVKSGDPFLHIVIYSDFSGTVLSASEDVLFDFSNKQELLTWLKQK